MQIHVVTAANRHLYTREMLEVFRQRYSIYVHEKRWREENKFELEIDQYDTPAATYLVGIEDGQVICGSRLISTTMPHMADEIFANLSNLTGVLRSPTIAEWTRAYIIPERREHGIGPIKGQICAAVMEYCLREGLEQVGGIQDLYWMRLWKKLDWKVTPTGTPAKVDGRWCVVAYMEVSPEGRDSAIEQTGALRHGLVWRGPYQPFVTAEPLKVAGGSNAA